MDIQLLKNITKNSTLLYVEDEALLRDSIGRYLKKLFDYVSVASDGQDGLKLYKQKSYDIVITDIQMPYMNGLEMIQEIKKLNPEQEIIIISAYGDTNYFLEAIKLGVNGYILKPVNNIQMNQVLYQSMFKITNYKENLEYKTHLEEMVDQRTREKLTLESEKIENFEKTLASFVTMIEDRDTYTGGHSQRVANYSRMLAKHMNCSQEDCDLVYRAGILHDIGKVTTPDSILLKPGKLNALEYKIIQEHVTESYNILLKIPMYKEIAEIVICHHERYDGSGYPKGIKQDKIPLLAHIMIVADAFDAMSTDRIYKGRKNVKTAINELVSLSSISFHPEVIQSARLVFADIELLETTHQLPVTELEKERFSYFYRDQLTNAYNTDYLNFILSQNIFDKEYVCINTFYLHNFTQYNQKHGWLGGNKLLGEVVDILYQQFNESLVFRVHGNNFVVVSKKHFTINLNEDNYINKLQKNHIGVTHFHLDLKDEEIESFKVLEKLIFNIKKS